MSYILSFLTLEMIVKGVLGLVLPPETVNCFRTDLFHHYVVCILSWQSRTVILDCMGDIHWPKQSDTLMTPRKKPSAVWSELPARC